MSNRKGLCGRLFLGQKSSKVHPANSLEGLHPLNSFLYLSYVQRACTVLGAEGERNK